MKRAEFARQVRDKGCHHGIAHAGLHWLGRGIGQGSRQGRQNGLGRDRVLVVVKGFALQQGREPDRHRPALARGHAGMNDASKLGQAGRSTRGLCGACTCTCTCTCACASASNGIDRGRVPVARAHLAEQALLEQIAKQPTEVLANRTAVLAQQKHGIQQAALALAALQGERLAGQFFAHAFERPDDDRRQSSQDELTAIT